MPTIGDPAPYFSADTVNDMGHFDLSGFEDRGVVIIFAGITWCAPCRLEAEYLQRLADEFSRHGCQFVIVSVGDQGTGEDPWAFLKEALRSFGLNMPVIPESPGLLAAYEVAGVPYNFILARDHRICSIHLGALPEGNLGSNIAACLRVPYIPPEYRPGCAMAVLEFIRALGRGWIGRAREYRRFSPIPKDRE